MYKVFVFLFLVEVPAWRLQSTDIEQEPQQFAAPNREWAKLN